MVAVEPRKRKFHQPIFVSIPLPCNPSKINENTNIRLLCSGERDKQPSVFVSKTFLDQYAVYLKMLLLLHAIIFQ